MNFDIGDKVVCIDDHFDEAELQRRGWIGGKLPIEGELYTISGFTHSGFGLLLVGIDSRDRNGKAKGFMITRFRKVWGQQLEEVMVISNYE